jgi:hypothetical protein
MSNQQDFAVVVLMTVFIAACVWMYYYSDELQLKCIIATADGNRYCVRNRNTNIDTQKSAELLAAVTERMVKLVKHLGDNFPENPAVVRLLAGFDPKKISETLPNSELTAYTENKSKMSYCLTETKGGTKLIDLNTLTFVAVHEMSHIGTKSIGHKTEFWDVFKTFLTEAEKIGIYSVVDYKQNPKEFCSLKIRDSPILDM